MGPEGYSQKENMHFGGFSAGLRRPNHLAKDGGILVFGGLPPYSPDLNLLEFSIPGVLQPKGQVMPHANLVALRPQQNKTG
jgi:hypothetical protein